MNKQTYRRLDDLERSFGVAGKGPPDVFVRFIAPDKTQVFVRGWKCGDTEITRADGESDEALEERVMAVIPKGRYPRVFLQILEKDGEHERKNA